MPIQSRERASNNWLYVFVYGTLRRGGSNDISRYRPAPVLVAEAFVVGMLHDLGRYPSLRLGVGVKVRGEVYRIERSVEEALDVLEEVKMDGSGEYVKRYVPVALDASSPPIECLVYEIQADRVQKAPLIAGGDWIAWAAHRGIS